MAEAIGRAGELDRHIGPALGRLLVVGQRRRLAIAQDVRERGRGQHAIQIVVQHQPLIVPAHDAHGGAKAAAGLYPDATEGLDQRLIADDLVVEADEGALQLNDDTVLVIALVAEDRRVGTLAGGRRLAVRIMQAQDIAAGLHLFGQRLFEDLAQAQMQAIGLVEIGLIVRSASVDAVQIQRRRAEVLDRGDVDVAVPERGRIERQVVINELSEIGIAGGNAGVFVDSFSDVDLHAGVAFLDHRLGDSLKAVVAQIPSPDGEHAPEPADAGAGRRGSLEAAVVQAMRRDARARQRAGRVLGGGRPGEGGDIRLIHGGASREMAEPRGRVGPAGKMTNVCDS